MPTCRSCGAPIGFVRLESGKHMPVDPELVKTFAVPYIGTGPVRVLVTERGQVRRWTEVSLTAPGAEAVSGFESHFGSCPHAKAHRQAR